MNIRLIGFTFTMGTYNVKKTTGKVVCEDWNCP
jgi:hypothetical protein